jgi:hypothetical protein
VRRLHHLRRGGVYEPARGPADAEGAERRQWYPSGRREREVSERHVGDLPPR